MSLRGKRTKEPPSRGTTDLPLDLMILIIKKMALPPRYYDAENFALMRQVSRAWRSAVEAYSGSLSVGGRHYSDLKDYCSFLPSLSRLHVTQVYPDSLDLSGLLACTGLTALNLTNYGARTSRLDARNVPGNLKTLSLHVLHIDPEGVEQLMCHDLTQLNWAHTFCPADFSLLLPRLSKLQDLSLTAYSVDLFRPESETDEDMDDDYEAPEGNFDRLWVERELTGNLGGLNELTRLEINEASFIWPAKPSDCPTALRALTLYWSHFTIAWLTTFLAQLPKLMSLWLDGCSMLDSAGAKVPLKDLQWSYVPFSRLPDPSLQPFTTLRELRWETFDEVRIQPAEVEYIASLTALTSLRLRSFYDWSSLKPLQTLPLQSLWLTGCSHMELDLLVPDALQSLTEIHIRDTFLPDCPCGAAKYDAASASLVHLFEGAAVNLLRLPNLRRLTGKSKTNSLVMEKALQDSRFTYQERA